MKTTIIAFAFALGLATSAGAQTTPQVAQAQAPATSAHPPLQLAPQATREAKVSCMTGAGYTEVHDGNAYNTGWKAGKKVFYIDDNGGTYATFTADAAAACGDKIGAKH